MNMYEYFLTQSGNPMIKHANYFIVYERYFRRFVNRPVLFFEIGTGDGGSARLWKRYFGPMARIVTIDIRDLRHFEESQIYVRTGHQSDPAFLRKLVEEFGQPDIVLDDGSHHMSDINGTFDVLFPLTHSCGVYLVEDLSSCYWESFGGGYRNPASFIEKCKNLVDELNATMSGAVVPETAFSQSAISIAFYAAMIAIEKSPYINREALNIPAAAP